MTLNKMQLERKIQHMITPCKSWLCFRKQNDGKCVAWKRLLEELCLSSKFNADS